MIDMQYLYLNATLAVIGCLTDTPMKQKWRCTMTIVFLQFRMLQKYLDIFQKFHFCITQLRKPCATTRLTFCSHDYRIADL